MSSFRKRHVPNKLLPGTRTSVQTGQVITSSGNPSLDLILGGGLPIGSICLIEEDKFVTHSKVLARYFLAEGVLWHQSIFLGSLDDSPKRFLRKLPSPLNEQELEMEKSELQEEDGQPKNGLRIAWRYENLPLVNSEQATARIGHHFNLLKYMDPFFLDLTETVTWCARDLYVESSKNDDNDEESDDTSIEEHMGISPIKQSSNNITIQSNDDISIHTDSISRSIDNLNAISANAENDALKSADDATTSEESTTTTGGGGGDPAVMQKPKIFHNNKFQRLLTEIHALLLKQRFNEATQLEKSLCRVCITSLGSPLWFDEQFSQDILKFLTILRSIVRSQTSVCFITMPMNLIAKYDKTLVPKIRNLVDYAIELESFAGSERETHPAFKEYNGLLHIHKMSAINTLTTYMPETCDLAFKLRRKKFVIEKLHLPPELQDDNNDDNSSVPVLNCSSSNPKASLDF